jgi:hypothetical protein
MFKNFKKNLVKQRQSDTRILTRRHRAPAPPRARAPLPRCPRLPRAARGSALQGCPFPMPARMPRTSGVPCRRTLLYPTARSYRGRRGCLGTTSTVRRSQAGTPVALKGDAAPPAARRTAPAAGRAVYRRQDRAAAASSGDRPTASSPRLSPPSSALPIARRPVHESSRAPTSPDRQPRRPPPPATGVPALRQPLTHNRASKSNPSSP